MQNQNVNGTKLSQLNIESNNYYITLNNNCLIVY